MIAARKKNIKFLTLYNSFNETEKTEFSKFIKNGLNGKMRNYNKILSSLKINEKGIVEISDANSSRTRWNRLSELSLLADKFLVIKSLESESIENKYLLLKEYNKRNLLSAFEHSYFSLKKEIAKETVINYEYNLIYKLDKIYFNKFKSVSNPKKGEVIFTQTDDLRTAVQLIELLESLIELWDKKITGTLNTKTLNEEIFESLDFERILSHLSKAKGKVRDVLYYKLKYLYLIYLSLNDPSDNDIYAKAKRIIYKELKLISKEERIKYYNYLMDTIIERANNSISDTETELFYLFNRKLKEGITDDIERKDISLNRFRDYIITAIDLGKYKWAENFINKYGSLLYEDIRDDNVLLGKAFISMKTGKYLLCYEILSRIKKKNPFFFVDVAFLKLKALFELKNFEECYNELKNFKEYLRKERKVQKHLIVYAKEFCRAYFLLLKLYNMPSAANLNDLQFLLSRNELIGKKWITSKMSEIVSGS